MIIIVLVLAWLDN